MLPRIIKKSQQAKLPIKEEELTQLTDRRIPRQRVLWDPGHDGREGHKRQALARGVLRTRQTVPAEPVRLPAFEARERTPVLLFEDEAESAKEHDPISDIPPELIDRLEKNWDAKWAIRMTEAEERARIEGLQEGYEAARDELMPMLLEVQNQLESVRSALASDALAHERLWTTYIEEAQPQLIDLAFAIAEAVLDTPLPHDLQAVSSQALSTAIEHIAEDAPMTVSLHPVDMLRLEEAGIVRQLQTMHPGMRWNADAEMMEGDWAVDTSQAVVRHIKAELIEEMKQQLRDG